MKCETCNTEMSEISFPDETVDENTGITIQFENENWACDACGERVMTLKQYMLAKLRIKKAIEYAQERKLTNSGFDVLAELTRQTEEMAIEAGSCYSHFPEKCNCATKK